MARRGTEKRKLAGQVLVRLTADQQAAVAARALSAQLSTAAWLRIEISKLVGVDPGSVKIRAIPPSVILELANLRSEVARLFGALVQAGNTAEQSGADIQYMEIEQLISLVRSTVLELDALKIKLWRPFQ